MEISQGKSGDFEFLCERQHSINCIQNIERAKPGSDQSGGRTFFVEQIDAFRKYDSMTMFNQYWRHIALTFAVLLNHGVLPIYVL